MEQISMKNLDVSKRGIGINFTDHGSAEITVWSPLANAVSIQTNGGSIPLQKGEMGYWHATSTTIKEGSSYKIKVDEGEPLPDPASVSQPKGVHNESEAINLQAFPWQEGEWANQPLEDYI
ncbi:MAG: malto-oligosyltrehalose trehalohydrolase, partial [Chitinophagaceae bacterium]